MPILQADQIMDYEDSLWGQVIKGNQDQVPISRIYHCLPDFTEDNVRAWHSDQCK